MARSTRILVLVSIIAFGLFGLKSLAITSDVLSFLDPATPAWALSGGKKKEKKKKGGHEKPAKHDEASTPAPALVPEPASEHKEAAATPVCEGPSPAEQAGLSEQELNVYLTLGQRNRLLNKRESEIATREGLLKVTQQQIDERIAKLESLKSDINSLLGQLDEKEEAQIQTLIKLYDTMKPKPAAKIFTGLDKDVLLRVASRIKSDNLAKIMAAMPASKAAELTVALAASNRLPEMTKDLPGYSSGGQK
jgi:flagellar motility protein MotE (MotC chaperone)